MKALALMKTGSPDFLEYRDDLPIPTPKDDEVLVRINGAAFNRVDQLIVNGYPGLAMKFPHIPGADIAGRVAGFGKSVNGWKEGDHVSVYPLISCNSCTLCNAGYPNLCERWQYFGMHRNGGYAEYVTVPARNLASFKSSVEAAKAASLGVSGITAIHALNMNPDLRPGSSLMIWGATGGVGTVMIQLAKLRNLTVIATTRQQEYADPLKSLGADHVFDSSDPAIAEKLKELFPSGIDQIIDYVGPATFAKSFQLLRKGGTMTLCGILTGLETQFSIHQTYLRHLRVQGIYLGTHDEYKELLRLIGQGDLTVPIAARGTLADGQALLKKFSTEKHFGKVVLDIP